MEQELDDFLEFCENDVYKETAILAKDNMVSILALQSVEEGGMIYHKDPREDLPQIGVYDSEENARKYWEISLRTSIKNGWRIVYRGTKPNEG